MNTADKDILTALEALPSSTLLDVMDGMGNINTQMRSVYSMTPGQKMVGRAVTVRCSVRGWELARRQAGA